MNTINYLSKRNKELCISFKYRSFNLMRHCTLILLAMFINMLVYVIFKIIGI